MSIRDFAGRCHLTEAGFRSPFLSGSNLVAGQVTPGAHLARLAQRPQKDLTDLSLALKA